MHLRVDDKGSDIRTSNNNHDITIKRVTKPRSTTLYSCNLVYIVWNQLIHFHYSYLHVHINNRPLYWHVAIALLKLRRVNKELDSAEIRLSVYAQVKTKCYFISALYKKISFFHRNRVKIDAVVVSPLGKVLGGYP